MQTAPFCCALPLQAPGYPHRDGFVIREVLVYCVGANVSLPQGSLPLDVETRDRVTRVNPESV